MGRVTDPAQIGDLVIRQEADHSIRVRDVGNVVDGEEDEESAALVDGEPTVLLGIRKQSGSNTVQVADRIKERLDDLTKQLPAGYSLDIVRDESNVIRTSVDAVKEHLVAGALLAAVVVFFFLGNVRSTIIAAIAIPTSIIGTFAAMWIAGYTLNTITLLALALAVGIVIDDAIVVLENIFRHIEEKKQAPLRRPSRRPRRSASPSWRRRSPSSRSSCPSPSWAASRGASCAASASRWRSRSPSPCSSASR